MSKVERKRERKPMERHDFLDIMIESLRNFSERSKALANALLEGMNEPTRRLNRKERELADLAVNLHAFSVLDEAKLFAASGEDEMFMDNMSYVIDLMKFKQDL